jgi:hypothetical protein
LDKEFLALSVVFMLLGLTGILLFGSLFSPYHSITPVMECGGQVCSNPSTADSCFCIISSPEPSAAQGTSSIILALGVIFFPMGLMKGGLPTFSKGPSATAPIKLPSGRVVSPIQIGSGKYFAFGLALLLIGADAVLVPGLLVYKNIYIELAGGMLTAAGAISMAWGVRKPQRQ